MKTLSDVHVLSACDKISSKGIQELADTYNADNHEAPVVIGHPKDNAPAWGWVKNLKVKEGGLYADLEVQDSLYSMLKQKLFGKRSVSFYDSNPKRFRHLGFLGAQPPHVKGLEPLSLSDQDNTVTLSETMDEKEDLKPTVLYALSDLLPGITASSFNQEPNVDSDGVMTGIVSLGDTEYSYKIEDDLEGNWLVETSIANGETVELAERVKTLEAQIARTAVSSEVKALHEAKLTPQIISLDDCVDLVINDESGNMLTLLKKLPKIVDMSDTTQENPQQSEESPLEFAKRLLANQ